MVGGVVVYLLKSEHEAKPSPPPPTAFSPVTGKEAGRLADRFRPLLEFDSREKWRPISLDSLLAERNPDGSPAQMFCTRPPATEPGCRGVGSVREFSDDVTSTSAIGASTYLDLAGTKLSDYHAPDRNPAAIYYRVTSATSGTTSTTGGSSASTTSRSPVRLAGAPEPGAG